MKNFAVVAGLALLTGAPAARGQAPSVSPTSAILSVRTDSGKPAPGELIFLEATLDRSGAVVVRQEVFSLCSAPQTTTYPDFVTAAEAQAMAQAAGRLTGGALDPNDFTCGPDAPTTYYRFVERPDPIDFARKSQCGKPRYLVDPEQRKIAVELTEKLDAMMARLRALPPAEVSGVGACGALR